MNALRSFSSLLLVNATLMTDENSAQNNQGASGSSSDVEEDGIDEAARSTTTSLQYRKSFYLARQRSTSRLRGVSRSSSREDTLGEATTLPSTDGFDYKAEQLDWWRLLLRSVQAIGLIYGDLGTSPLYTVSSLFDGNTVPSEFTILAAGSMIFWLLLLVPSLKYAFLVAMADHNGEGGALAMIGLMLQGRLGRRWARFAIIVAVIGAGALVADGALTPAITVVSAFQGIQVGAPSFPTGGVVGLSIGVLVLIFGGQFLGSSRLGITYGPVLIVFFIVQAMLGIYGITKHPAIFKALNPYYALRGIGVFWNNGKVGYLKIADALLCVTGSEAMYADMGHFGRTPMRIGWFLVVLPSVLLSYLGQLAMLAAKPSLIITAGNALYFYQSPSSLLWPVIVLSTLAAVIASQSIISGTFSIVSQAISLELLPRMHVKRTDWRIFGQVFIPEMDVLMGALTVAITAGFQTSSALTSAYGVAVTTSFLTTSILFLIILALVWKRSAYVWIGYISVFGLLDLLLWSSALTKFPTGGYIPVIIAIVFILVMLVWDWGVKREREYYLTKLRVWRMHQKQARDAAHLPVLRGTFVFLTSHRCGVPYTYQIFEAKIGVLPQTALFVTVRFVPVPFVDEHRRFAVTEDVPGRYRIRIYVGYAQSIGSLMELLRDASGAFSIDFFSEHVVFVKGRTEILADQQFQVLHRALAHTYGFMKRFAVPVDSDLGIPRDRVELGMPVAL
jgi:KUP system potassium uptake protein